ncbi:MAG: general secretion pathway protein GspK [Opitutaceae bacterium]
MENPESNINKDACPQVSAAPHASRTRLRASIPTHSPRSAASRRSRSRSGSVLVAVLAIILLLSFMITRFMHEAVEDLEYRALFNEPADVRSFAFSMLEVSLATVQEVALIDEGKLYAPEQGWKDPISYAGIVIPNDWDVQITITDEGGKLPLNTMSEELLNKLLEEQLDIDYGTARELSSTLSDWIDENDTRRLNGAESDEYLDRNPPYKAANAPLQSLEELRLLQTWEDEFFDEFGNPNELFDQLSGLVSVMNTGKINLNAAPQEVIDIIALEDGFQEDSIWDGIDEPYLKEPPGSTGGVEITLLRVTVRLSRGETPFTLSALLEPNFSEEGASGGNAPGSSSEDAPKTGTAEEQDAIQYPFKILQISEYTRGNEQSTPARYSAMDIDGEGDSF